MELKTKQTLAVVLSITGAVGTLATALLVRESAKKEQETYQTLLPFKKGNIKDILMLYKAPIAVGTLTIGSIIGSTVMSHKAQASLMSMAVLADQGWKKYKHQVKSTLGLDTHKDMLKGIARKSLKDISVVKRDENDTRELYYDEIVGYFQAKPEDVAFAYAEINEMLNTDYRNQLLDVYDFVTLGRFLSLANAELLDEKASKDAINTWGWTSKYLVESYTWCWIHMNITREISEDGDVPINVISWVEDPILIDTDNLYGNGSLLLDGVDVEEFDGVSHKKYTIQQESYKKKADTK